VSGLTERTGDAGERIFSADDAHVALEFVQWKLKEGAYQYFRGQEDSCWRPSPSWSRIPEQVRHSAEERVSLFLDYTRRIALNAGIVYSDDALIAIAQHYGLPTTFLDLTTDPIVAALFACPPDTRHGNAKSAIFLYSDTMIREWQKRIEAWSGSDRLELIRIDVSNLWRLQAQRGLFLYVGVTNLCDNFMPDWIEFPHPTSGLRDSNYNLYPVQKSPLELQIDLFFDLEASELAKQELRDTIPAHHITPAFSTVTVPNTTLRLASALHSISEEWISHEKSLHATLRNNIDAIGNWPLRTLPDTYYEPTWEYKTGELWPHASWFDESADAWLRTAVEPLPPTPHAGEHAIDVDLATYGNAIPCGDRVLSQSVFPVDGASRGKSPCFRVRDSAWRESNPASPPGSATEIEQRFGLVARNLWDGIRGKPLSDLLIAGCMDRFFVHCKCFLDCDLRGEPTQWDACYGTRDVDHLKVEYAALGGHSRSLQVLCSDLALAVRPDFDQIIGVAQRISRSPFPHLTQMIYPQYLFEFGKLVELYCIAMLPYQAFIGAITWRKHLGLAFNPRQLKIFGLA